MVSLEDSTLAVQFPAGATILTELYLGLFRNATHPWGPGSVGYVSQRRGYPAIIHGKVSLSDEYPEAGASRTDDGTWKGRQ